MMAGLTAAYHTCNRIVEYGAENDRSAALGVETELGSANFHLTVREYYVPFCKFLYNNNLSFPLT